MQHPTNHIFAHTPDSLSEWCERARMPKFRANQILEWVYQKGTADPEKMSNLSKLDRDRLKAEMTFLSGNAVAHQIASDGTQKLLIEWQDGDAPAAAASSDAPAHNPLKLPLLNVTQSAGDSARQTECVMIPSQDAENGQEPSRRTACISSQIGCPVGCKFCASGIGGLDGNLSAGRIVEQVWRLGQLPNVRRITNVVFMGMGEPLSNLGAVVPAIKTIASLWALGISARKITVSTVGLPKAIEKLSEQLDLPITLALSLHATNDETRRRLIPWAEYTTIKDLLAACQRWFDKTGREITLEYTLLKGVNDSSANALELVQLAGTLRANVNLIRYNEVQGMPFERPKSTDVLAFQEILREKNINVHIRASRGRDIAAACGQLRHERSVQGGAKA